VTIEVRLSTCCQDIYILSQTVPVYNRLPGWIAGVEAIFDETNAVDRTIMDWLLPSRIVQQKIEDRAQIVNTIGDLGYANALERQNASEVTGVVFRLLWAAGAYEGTVDPFRNTPRFGAFSAAKIAALDAQYLASWT